MASAATTLNGTKALACVCALSMLLLACPKKGDGVDAAPEAAPVPVATEEPDAGDVAPTTTSTTTPGWKPPPKKDAGADGGAAAGDGGAAAAVDAGPPGAQCCCEITGQPLANLLQTECVTVKKGACVPKGRCAGAGLDAGVQQCCCKVGETKSFAAQSECTTIKKGTCVKKTECK